MKEDKETSDLIGQRKIRLNKVQKLRDMGIDPYPAKSNRTHKAADIKENYDNLENETVVVAGRLVSMRSHGPLVFGDLRDQSGDIQLYIKKDEINDTNIENGTLGFEELNLVDVGDIVEARGYVTKTDRGEISIAPKEIKILTKSIRPLPSSKDGIQDREILLRKRYLDTIINPDHRMIFEYSAKIVFAIREFLNHRGFLEIQTPIIQPIYGGGTAKPFTTRVNALGLDYYLAISHELYLKRLITAGFENVYNLNGYFRNEGIDRTHNPQFNMIETMTAFQNYEFNMDLIEEMYKYIGEKVFGKTTFMVEGQEVDFGKPWERIMMIDAVKKYAGVDFNEIKTIEEAHKVLDAIGFKDEKAGSIGEVMVQVFEEKVEEHLIQPTFVYGHPVEISPLAKRMHKDKRFVERFEIFIGGIEGGDNWTELNDPIELYERFKDQFDKGKAGAEEFHPMDVDFLETIEYGMPPTTGLGPGIERLIMMFTEERYIDDILFFPMMKRAPYDKIQKEIYGEEYLVDISEMSSSTNSNASNFDLSNINVGDRVKIDDSVLEKYPGIKTGYIVLEDVKVQKSNSELEKLKSSLTSKVRSRFSDQNAIKEDTNINSFRELYKNFGADPNSTLNSVEALLRRVVKGSELYNINNVVDTYNATSMEFALPMAAYNLDAVKGQIILREANTGETITKILEEEPTEVKEGTLAYADHGGIVCMNYNYRDSDRTKITNDTNEIIVFVDGTDAVDEAEIKTALATLAERLEKFTGGKVTEYAMCSNNLSSSSENYELPTRETAKEFVHKYVEDEYQRHHAEMVATAMEAVAKELGEDEELFYITGLVHDWDYDKWPEEHPSRYEQLKEELGVPEVTIDAIKGHADLSFNRKTLVERALLACDEFSGLLYAYMKMVGNYKDMKLSSINKKVHKDLNFAAKISRQDVLTGINELGIPEERFYELVRNSFVEKYDLSEEERLKIESERAMKIEKPTASVMKQDHTKRMAVVVLKDLEGWQFANTIGHITSYLGHNIKENFSSTNEFKTKDGAIPPNSQYPVIVKSAKSKDQLFNLLQKVEENDLVHIAFTAEMIEHNDDVELQNDYLTKNRSELNYLGIGIFGDNEKIKQLTNKFSLYN